MLSKLLHRYIVSGKKLGVVLADEGGYTIAKLKTIRSGCLSHGRCLSRCAKLLGQAILSCSQDHSHLESRKLVGQPVATSLYSYKRHGYASDRCCS
jgi:hypothetical protein